MLSCHQVRGVQGPGPHDVYLSHDLEDILTVIEGRALVVQELAEAPAAVRGHVVPGCRVRTTAEVLLGLLPGWAFSREVDATTGYAELVPRPRLS